MDTDVYNIGEVVEFTVTNDGSRTLDCAGDPPAFVVKTQGINGAWGTKIGNDTPDTSKKSTLAPGASTPPYRFVTDGWTPGRYRIVLDCGVVREFILKPNPTPEPTPLETPVLNGTVNSPVNETVTIPAGPAAGAPANATVTVPLNTPAPPLSSLRYAGNGILNNGPGSNTR